MKRNFKSIFAAFAAFAVVLSCSKVDESDSSVNSGNEVSGETTISATLTDALTKVAFTPSYGTDGKPESLVLTWEAGDKLRVYNHADKTQYEDFELVAASVGQKTGQFTGTLPVAESYDVEIINGDVDYAAQVQPADGVTSSLKYLASVSAVADVKTLAFTDYSSVLAITAKLPEGVAAGIGSVDVTASEAIFNTGKTLTISLAEKGDAGDDGILHLFANLPQGDRQIPEGTTLLMHFNAPDTDHTVYTRYVELDASAFTAGKLNTINVNASQSDRHAGLETCDGSSSDKAYLIGDKYQLNAMSGLVSEDAATYFAMVSDIDMDETSWNTVSGKVNFEGNNHKITNVNAVTGLFSSFDGYIKNVIVEDAKVTATSEKIGILVNDADYIAAENVVINNATLSNTMYPTGMLIGHMEEGVLSGCKASGTLTTDYYYSGGLVGYASTATVTNCSAAVKVSNNRTNYSRTGGLIGEIHGGSVTRSYTTGNSEYKGAYGGGFIGVIDGDVTVKECYATGEVKQTNTKNYHGGLIGWIANGTVRIENCYATGAVRNSGGNYCGGLIGYSQATSLTIQNCYSKSEIESKNAYSGCIFISDIEVASTLTCTGFIGWNVSNKGWCFNTAVVPGELNYNGTEGSISAKAKEFNWDESIWDLTGSEPVLK